MKSFSVLLCTFYSNHTTQNRTAEWTTTTTAAVFFEHISSSYSFCLFFFYIFAIFIFQMDFFVHSPCVPIMRTLCSVLCVLYAICDMCRVVCRCLQVQYVRVQYTPCQLPDVSLSTVCRLFFSLSRDFIHLFSINLKNALVAPKSVSVCERKRVANWNDTAHSTMIVIILYVSGIIAISKCKQ